MVIFDRGVPDSVPYLELSGDAEAALKGIDLEGRYTKVFIFDPVEFEDDEVRNDFDRQHVVFLDERLEAVYLELGYDIVRVANGTVEQRANFIITEILKSLNLRQPYA